MPALPQAIGDSVSIPMAVLDRAGVIIMTNESWERFARENHGGGPEKTGPGVNYLEVCRSACGEGTEGAQEVLAGLRDILDSRKRDFLFEYPCHSPTLQRWFILHANALEGAGGGAVLLHFDITARKEMEARLQEYEVRFRLALQNSPVVLFNQDRGLRYTWINCPVLAWAERDYLGRTDTEILGASDGERLTAIKRAVLKTGVGTRVETTVTFQGDVHYYDLNVEPLRDAAGGVQGITCACTDITPAKRAAAERERLIEELETARRELVRRNLELEALNNEKTQWLAMAAHDLRNPLSAIEANCELLMIDLAAAPPDVTDAVVAVHSSAGFMLKLLDDVLDISVIESGKQRFTSEQIDLRRLIEETIALSRPLGARKKMSIEGRFPEQLPRVAADRPKMAQVMLNLIDNAIKYSPEGTGILVTVDLEPDNVRLSVHDNGPG